MPYSFTNGHNRLDGALYDAAGDLENDGVNTYCYDGEGRVVKVFSGNQPCNAPSPLARYVYDAEGRRVERVTAQGTWDAAYDLAGRAVSEYDAADTWSRGEVWAGSRHLATYHDYNWPDAALYFSSPDGLGSERLRTRTDGSLAETCTALPFGDGQACSGSDPSPLHFTGKPRDAETGLDDFGARNYASSLGRWMTPDWSAQAEPVPYAKLDNPQSLNLYTYVLNNPVSRIDPDGHCCLVWLDPVLIGVAKGAEVGSEVGAAGGTAVEPGGGTLAGELAGATIGAAVGFGVGVYWAANNEKENSGTTPNLVGNNPKETKGRTLTDLPGGHDEAKAKFDEITKGQGRSIDSKTGHTVSDDGTRLRLNPNGTARIDMPKQDVPKPETIHFNDPKPAAASCSANVDKRC